MDGHHPESLGVQNSAYRFTRPEIFPRGFYVANDADEAQALTRGLSKVGTRVKAASQQGWAGLLNGGASGKLILSWMIYRRSFAISFSFVLTGGARSGRPFMMR